MPDARLGAAGAPPDGPAVGSAPQGPADDSEGRSEHRTVAPSARNVAQVAGAPRSFVRRFVRTNVEARAAAKPAPPLAGAQINLEADELAVDLTEPLRRLSLEREPPQGAPTQVSQILEIVREIARAVGAQLAEAAVVPDGLDEIARVVGAQLAEAAVVPDELDEFDFLRDIGLTPPPSP